MCRRESFIAKFASSHVTFEGSIDDDETLKTIKHWVERINFDAFDADEPKQVEAKIGDILYYICSEDVRLPLPAMREKIKSQRERRFILDRRHKDRQTSRGRRSTDHSPAA